MLRGVSIFSMTTTGFNTGDYLAAPHSLHVSDRRKIERSAE